MQTETLYWTIVAAIVGALWAVAIFVRDRNLSAAQLSSALVGRVLEIDRFLMEHPDIQKYMSLTVTQTEDSFRDPEVLQDERFYKAKSLAYYHLNLFDELLSVAKSSEMRLKLLMSPRVIELSDWEEYIRLKLRHPLYRSILNNEGKIFGETLREFWATFKNSPDHTSANPYDW